MRRFKLISLFFLIGIVVLFSIGKTIEYYFFTDDYVFLYYLRNNLNFGWPYSSVLSLFRPIYQVFGINPLPYFAMAIITYFFAAISVFYFTKTLTKNSLIAGLSSLTFATGYIGLDQFTMIAVSIINNLNVINVCITLIFLTRFIETKKYRYYFLTFFMFWFSLLLFPYRAYPLVLLLPTIEIIRIIKFGNVKHLIKQICLLFIRYIPFFIVGVSRGIFSYGTHGTDHVEKLNLINPDSKVYTLFYIDFFKELFAVIGKFFFIKPLSDILNFNPDQSFYSMTGLLLLVIVILVSLKFILEKKTLDGKNLLILLLLTIESYIGNMFLNVDFDANGPINRYLTISFVFYAPLLILLLYLVFEKMERFRFPKKRIIIVLSTVLIIFCLSDLSRKYTASAVQERSEPSRKFFKELKSHVPSLSDSNYNVFYFDRASYYPVSSRFDQVLLSAAMGNSVNLALPYNISVNSVKIVDNYDDFLRMVLYPPKGRNVTYHSFYSDENGLQNTTSDFFELLKKGKISNILLDQIKYGKDENFPSAVINIENISSLGPVVVYLDLVATPLDIQTFEFPYKSGVVLGENIPSKSEKNRIFEYLISRKNYYNSVKVEVESIHVAKKNPASYLIDDNSETFWISDQSRWEVGIKPWIKVDLMDRKNINKVVLKQIPNRTVSSFDLFTSIDGINWDKAEGRLVTPFGDKDIAVIEFEKMDTRYLKFTINTLSIGPGPGLAEFEVVESNFSDVDLESAIRIKNLPFELIRDAEELSQIYAYLQNSAELKVEVFTNKDDPSFKPLTVIDLPIFLDGLSHRYEFMIPQQGTLFRKIKIQGNFPAKLFIEKLTLENQSSKIITNQIKKRCEEFMEVEKWKNPFDCSQVWEYNKPL